MVLFDLDAHGRHGREHFAAHVLRGIDRGNREIAALGADAVAEIAALVGRVGVGRQFDGVENEAGVIGSALKRTSSKTKNSASGPK